MVKYSDILAWATNVMCQPISLSFCKIFRALTIRGAIIHAFQKAVLDDAALLHLLAHADKQQESERARLFVAVLAADDDLGHDGWNEMEAICREQGNESQQGTDTILAGRDRAGGRGGQKLFLHIRHIVADDLLADRTAHQVAQNLVTLLLKGGLVLLGQQRGDGTVVEQFGRLDIQERDHDGGQVEHGVRHGGWDRRIVRDGTCGLLKSLRQETQNFLERGVDILNAIKKIR